MIAVGVSGRQFCHNITVIDDDILEGLETYTVSLTSSDTDVVINTATASLVILDEMDGIVKLCDYSEFKFIHFCRSHN